MHETKLHLLVNYSKNDNMFFIIVFHHFLNLHKRRRRRLELMPQGFLPWGYDMNHLYLKYGRHYVGVLCAPHEVTNICKSHR